MAKEPRQDDSSLVMAAVAFEFMLGALAALLGWTFGVNPFARLAWRDAAPLLWDLTSGVVAALPLLGVLVWLRRTRLGNVRRLREFLHCELMPHFARASLWELAWVALAAGVGEELLFRGFLQTLLERQLSEVAWGDWLPLLLASLLFGLAHAVSWTYLVIATLVGLYLGWLFSGTNSLWVPLTAHAVYDFVALRWLQRDYLKQKRAT